MPSYKLKYFNITGLAEPIRFLLSYGGAEFEEERYEFEEWPAIKSQMPFGQVPVLEIDGKEYVQSISICRYLAKQFGLAGDNDLENLEIDSIVDAFNDLRIKISAFIWEPNEESKAKKGKTLIEETLPYYYSRWEEMVAKNDGHLALKRLTWADLYVASLKDYIDYAFKDGPAYFEGYPNLQKMVANTLAIESIKKWMDKRPTTTF